MQPRLSCVTAQNSSLVLPITTKSKSQLLAWKTKCFGTSPVIYRNVLVSKVDSKNIGGAVVGLNKNTGKIIWKIFSQWEIRLHSWDLRLPVVQHQLHKHHANHREINTQLNHVSKLLFASRTAEAKTLLIKLWNQKKSKLQSVSHHPEIKPV